MKINKGNARREKARQIHIVVDTDPRVKLVAKRIGLTWWPYIQKYVANPNYVLEMVGSKKPQIKKCSLHHWETLI